jgi:hypothetical protein
MTNAMAEVKTDVMEMRELSMSEIDEVTGGLFAEVATAVAEAVVEVINFVNEGNVWCGPFGGCTHF